MENELPPEDLIEHVKVSHGGEGADAPVEQPPPTEDEMVAQTRTFQTPELMQALDELRKTKGRLQKAMRVIIQELNRRAAIR